MSTKKLDYTCFSHERCPICQSELRTTQTNPIAVVCTEAYRGNRHIFEYLCYDDGHVHSYRYNVFDWRIDFWPPNPKYPDSEHFPHVVIRTIEYPNTILYAGHTTKDFVDFPKIYEYLKLLNLFS